MRFWAKPRPDIPRVLGLIAALLGGLGLSTLAAQPLDETKSRSAKVAAVRGEFVKLETADTSGLERGQTGTLHRGADSAAVGAVVLTVIEKTYVVGRVTKGTPQADDVVRFAANESKETRPATASRPTRKPAPQAKPKPPEPTEEEKRAAKPADYRSANFLVHTDLTPSEAQELLERLETMLKLISTYWGRPSSGVIECYVVRDLSKFPADAIPPMGRMKIEEGAGVTISQKMTVGNKFMAKAMVYSVPDRGVPQHEAVHAYCQQTFGDVGPTWYSEGMAEMGNYWVKDDPSVQAEPIVLKYLKSTQPRSLREIVEPEQPPGTWQEYAWRWALCHVLANNTNYAPRFRPLGIGMLTGQPVSFAQVYAPMADQISFEYLFFIEHMDTGYRADLCSWDWRKKFLPLGDGGRSVAARINAPRGWQPTGLKVEAGVKYAYEAKGDWHIGDGAKVDANGAADGRGRLVGVLFKDFKLGEPFELGVSGVWEAPADGDLYLRCRDGWCEIADNSGTMLVKVKRAE